MDWVPAVNFGLALPGAALALRVAQVRREDLVGTTLSGPARWLEAALVVWVVAQGMPVVVGGLSPGAMSRLEMFALSLLLAPFVSVLGAKRPGARVWDLFVVVPMLLVLNWPAWAAVLQGNPDQAVDLEGPAILAVGVVLLLTLGNYFGTGFTGAALLSLTAVAAGWTELSGLLPRLGPHPMTPRIVVSLGLWGGFFLAVQSRRTEAGARSGLNGAWLDLRDWFGILWARRLAERINQTARQENWPLDVGLDGLHWREPVDAATRQATSERLEQTLRWLLRRFVDDAWLDRRLRGQ